MPRSHIKAGLRFASALAPDADALDAALLAAERCAVGLGGGGRADLAFLFVSRELAHRSADIASIVQRELQPGLLVGCTGVGVIADATELESSPGVALLAARLPGVTLKAASTDDLIATHARSDGNDTGHLGELIGAGPDLRACFLIADPFSVPLVRLLPALNAAGAGVPVFGGMASAASEPGGNFVIHNDRVQKRGGVLVSMSGPVRVDGIVSQGCRGFGPNFVITKARRNIILELGGRKAMEVVSEVVGELPEPEREGLKQGLFIGRVVNEYKSHFGRGDFLIRGVVGVDQGHGALAVSDQMSVGQTVRLHLRDAKTAHEDLALLLDAQKLHANPAGVLLFTCNGRGKRLFGTPNHDANAIQRAFLPPEAGESSAKPGISIAPGAVPPVPLAGFFAAGEIGPIEGASFVHAHTACAALFREEVSGEQ